MTARFKPGDIVDYLGRQVRILSSYPAKELEKCTHFYRVETVEDGKVARRVPEDALKELTLQGQREMWKSERSKILRTLREANARLREIDDQLLGVNMMIRRQEKKNESN